MAHVYKCFSVGNIEKINLKFCLFFALKKSICSCCFVKNFMKKLVSLRKSFHVWLLGFIVVWKTRDNTKFFYSILLLGLGVHRLY